MNEKQKLEAAQKRLEEQKRKVLRIEQQIRLKTTALKRSDLRKSRAIRNQRIYKLGGCVDKMGLLWINEEVLLYMLNSIYHKLKSTSPEELDDYARKGIKFMPVGKKLDQLYPQPTTEKEAGSHAKQN